MNNEQTLQDLVVKGKKQGYLTYSEVTSLLPDEASGSEQLDSLIVALENSGIELCEQAPESAEPNLAEIKTEEIKSLNCMANHNQTLTQQKRLKALQEWLESCAMEG